jgi:hypothetical protein
MRIRMLQTADADAYHDGHLYATDWTGATSAIELCPLPRTLSIKSGSSTILKLAKQCKLLNLLTALKRVRRLRFFEIWVLKMRLYDI